MKAEIKYRLNKISKSILMQISIEKKKKNLRKSLGNLETRKEKNEDCDKVFF